MQYTDVKKVYTQMFDEEKRLCNDKASSIEFMTNKKYILQELKKGDKILELGAATGRYTLAFAELGYEVTALEYVEENLDVLRSKLQRNHKVIPVLGNACLLYTSPSPRD